MATVILLPDPARLDACREVLRLRANRLGATKALRRRALAVLIRELEAGRSTAAALALAFSELHPMRHAWHPSGGAA